MYKFKMDDDYYFKVLNDELVEFTLYEGDGVKRHTYIFRVKEDESGRKFFTCFNRDFYI